MPRPFRPTACAAAFAALALALAPAQADDVETVKEKLLRAKKEYDGETRKFRAAVTEALDKREDAARKTGDKKAVDAVKGERSRFEKDGELPAMTPTAALAQMKAARADLDKAYTAAVKHYLRLKEDAAAEAAEKEQQKFALDVALRFGKRTYLVTLKHYDVKAFSNWFANDGTQADKKGVKYKLNGDFVPHSINIVPSINDTAQVKYNLNGKWFVFNATVGVPKIEDASQDPASGLTFEVLGDGKSLWKSEPVTKLNAFQSCTVRVEKVKVLSLLIHAAGKTEWARSVWFEPVLIE